MAPVDPLAPPARLARLLRAAALLCGALLCACGDKKTENPSPPAPLPTEPPSASASSLGPESPLSVVLESRGALVLSGLEGGVFVADARTHVAREIRGELASEPMPEGLPEGPGRIVRAGGRLPSAVWLVYEQQRADGKVEANPFFRLSKEGLKKYADDWKPSIVPWTKHRILAASTSSGRLKIKILEPSPPTPPPDLPSTHLVDASCEQTLKLAGLVTVPSGQVFAAGNCKPDTAAGAGPSAERYVVIRWGTPTALDATTGAPDSGPPDAGPLDAGRLEARPSPPDAGLSSNAPGPADAGPAGSDERPGLVDVIPGVSTHLTHVGFFARTTTDVWAAAHDPSGKPPGVSRLFHFDGETWGAVALPPAAVTMRAIAGGPGGVLWMVTERSIFRRDTSGAWQEVPPPNRAFPDAGAWEMLDAASPDGGDVWIAARRTTAAGSRDVILRTRPSPVSLRWE